MKCGIVRVVVAMLLLGPVLPVAAQNFSPEQLTRRTIERRAIEAANWGMPAVNYDRVFQAFKAAGGDFNQIVYWSGLFDWKNQVLTPNPDTIYLMPFFDTREVGPVVISGFREGLIRPTSIAIAPFKPGIVTPN